MLRRKKSKKCRATGIKYWHNQFRARLGCYSMIISGRFSRARRQYSFFVTRPFVFPSPLPPFVIFQVKFQSPIVFPCRHTRFPATFRLYNPRVYIYTRMARRLLLDGNVTKKRISSEAMGGGRGEGRRGLRSYTLVRREFIFMYFFFRFVQSIYNLVL